MNNSEAFISIPVGSKVIFTFDDWDTEYSGDVIDESVYSVLVKSFKYGAYWVGKSSVKMV